MIRSLVCMVVTLCLLGCGSSQIAGTEGGSSIEVVGYAGAVYGTAVQASGAPVNRGRAKLVKPRNRSTVSSDYTSENGVFSLPIRDLGKLGVIIYDSLNNGYYAPVAVENRSDSVNLDTVVLQPTATITGKINCADLIQWEQTEYYPEDFRLVVSELAKEFSIDTSGNFEIKDIPAGTYQIVISQRYLSISSYREPEYFDTVVTVNAGDQVSLPEIMLQLEPVSLHHPLFTKDSTVVQEVLDLNSIETPVMKHCDPRGNRIGSLVLKRGIDTIPPSIGELESLTDLEITSGALSTIPSELMNCKQLQTLTIRHTKIENVPYELSTLERLYKIDLSNNVLEEIPEFLMDMEFPPTVDLRYNSISPSDKERKWLLEHLFQNDSIQLAEWEATQSVTDNTNNL